MGSPMAPSNLTLSDLERSKSRSLRFWVVADLYGIHIFACSLLPPYSGCHRRELVGGGVFCCPSGPSCSLFMFSSGVHFNRLLGSLDHCHFHVEFSMFRMEKKPLFASIREDEKYIIYLSTCIYLTIINNRWTACIHYQDIQYTVLRNYLYNNFYISICKPILKHQVP